ncbi:MAG: hypothetical protein JNJ58_10165 [Chitinophagaceae bacterium]|nr:hypothetical protein [Chitinophagaceae bacterium]
MNNRFLLMIVSAGLLLASWKSKDQFPKAKVIRAYAQLLSDTSTDRDVSMKIAEITPIIDSIIEKSIPEFTFYFLTIYNGFHYEYNSGKIKTVVAISTIDSNDIRLLLPNDYAESSSNFLNLFYGKKIKNKENLCRFISGLFLKMYTSFDCNKEFRNLHHSVKSTNRLITITTSWMDICLEFAKDKINYKDTLVSKITTFSFEGDKLTSVDCADWER